MENNTLITVNFGKIGYGGKCVGENIVFSIVEGDYICITGENGSGKSTLVKTILGLLPPIEGSIEFSEGAKEKISYLPQQIIVQSDFPATVEEVVISGRQQKGFKKLFYNKEDKAAVTETLKRFKIENLAKCSFKELSGGQKQRVLIARALCGNRNILFLDEPVAGLDPTIIKELYEILNQINKEGTTIVMISHDIDSVELNAKHILKMGVKSTSGSHSVFTEVNHG